MRNNTDPQNPDLTLIDDYYESYTQAAKKPLWSWSDWEQGNPEHPFKGEFVDSTLTHITTGNKVRMTGAVVEEQTGTSVNDGLLRFRHFDPAIHRNITDSSIIGEVRTMWWPVFARAYTTLTKYDAITIVGTTYINNDYGGDEWIIPDRIYKRYPDGSASGESMMMSMGMEGEDTAVTAAFAEAIPGESEAGGGPVGLAVIYDDSSILQSDWFVEADSQTGAIGWALSQKDGAVLDLLGEHVVELLDGGQTLAIKEWFEPRTPSPRLVLKLGTSVQALVDTSATIDIVGATLTTLPDGRRALINPEAVYLYVDEDGNIAPPIPPGKDAGSAVLLWQWKKLIAP